MVDRYRLKFDSIGISAKYDLKVSETVSISPKLTYKYQEPWWIDQLGLEFIIPTHRLTANVTAIGELGAQGPADSINLLGGFEFFTDHAKAKKIGSSAGIQSEYFGGSRTVDYQNYAAFAQAEFETQWVNLTLGGRYHYHSEIGGKFVPRVALTKAWDRFHVKALFSQAFREPQIEIINFGEVDGSGDPKIKAETTTAYELEAGYRLSDTVSVLANAFWIEVADILVFSPVGSSAAYANFDAVINYGVEFEMRVADQWGNASVGYSFYRNYRNDVPAFCTKGSVSADPDCGEKNGLLLGFPAHKLTFNGTYYITNRLSLNLNGAFISKRISYAVGSMKRRTISPKVYPNLFLRYERAGFSVGAGVRDLFDHEYEYVQPYDGGVRELPGKGREFFLKASFVFDGVPFR